MTRSCGGIDGDAKAEEVVDASGLAWYGDGAVVLSSNASLTPSLPVMLSVYSNTLLLERQKVHKIATSPKIYVENHPLPYFVPQVVDTVQIFLPMFTGMGFMGIGLGGISLLKDQTRPPSPASPAWTEAKHLRCWASIIRPWRCWISFHVSQSLLSLFSMCH